MATLVLGKLLRLLISVGEYAVLIVEVIWAALKRPPSWPLLREQCYHIGVRSSSVVAVTGFTTGFVLAAQSIYQLSEKGLAGVTGILVGKAMITELGPVLTAFMVTGRVGSAMCAELGTMKVTEQIDALRSMAINPLRHLVAPRFFAGIIMVPLLTFLSIVMGIFGGYLIVSQLFHMTYSSFFTPMQQHIVLFDLLTGAVKSLVFGVILVTVCCFKGMKTAGGAAGVGSSTTQSVVISYMWILIWDFLLTLLLNTIHSQMLDSFS